MSAIKIGLAIKINSCFFFHFLFDPQRDFSLFSSQVLWSTEGVGLGVECMKCCDR